MDSSKLEWHHPTRSNPSGNCVEWAHDEEAAEVVFRDSKQNGQPDQPVLRFNYGEIAAFIGEVEDRKLHFVFDTKTLGGQVTEPAFSGSAAE